MNLPPKTTNPKQTGPLLRFENVQLTVIYLLMLFSSLDLNVHQSYKLPDTTVMGAR